MQSAIKVLTSQIRALEGPALVWKGGSDRSFATSVGTPNSLHPSQLVFVSSRPDLAKALETASLIIAENKIIPGSLDLKPDQSLWSTHSIKEAMALVLELFDPRKQIQGPLISPQAFVHPTAQIGSGTHIAAGAFIGAHARIGENCDIHANAVIEDFCQIGNRCVIHSNVTIGCDGFGFAIDKKGIPHKVPQIGIVVLEDDVEVGANTTIDRGTIGETRIGQGTKFDKHCHVAHNCRIGKYCVFAGAFLVAGSTTIGDHCMSGGSVVVTDHIQICDRVIFAGRSVVTKDVTEPGAYTGYPLEPLRDGLKTIQNLSHLTSMRRQLNTMAKRLGISEEEK